MNDFNWRSSIADGMDVRTIAVIGGRRVVVVGFVLLPLLISQVFLCTNDENGNRSEPWMTFHQRKPLESIDIDIDTIGLISINGYNYIDENQEDMNIDSSICIKIP